MNASSLITQSGKRPRDNDTEADRRAKREKADDSDEEMEIDDDEESPQKKEDACASCYSILKQAFTIQ